MAALNFPTTGLVAGVTQYTSDLGTTYIWDGVKWVGHSAGGSVGTNSISNNGYTVQVDTGGNLVLPTGGVIGSENSGNITLSAPYKLKLITDLGDNNNTWTFWAGDITLPPGGDILDSTGTSVLSNRLPADAAGYLINDGSGGLSWGAGDGTGSSIGNFTFTSDTVNMPLEAKLNSGGVGVPNSAEIGTTVAFDGPDIGISEVFMGSGYGEFRSIYNKTSPLESGLVYAGVEGFNYTQHGDVNFAGMVSQTPNIDSMYALSLNEQGQIVIGFTQESQTQTSTDWSVVVGTLTTDYTVNGLFANTARTVIASAGASGIELTTNRGTVLFGNRPEQPTISSHWHIMPADSSAIDLFFGNDTNYVKLPRGTGNVVIGAEGPEWTFDSDGVLTIPDAGIKFADGSYIKSQDEEGLILWQTDDQTANNSEYIGLWYGGDPDGDSPNVSITSGSYNWAIDDERLEYFNYPDQGLRQINLDIRLDNGNILNWHLDTSGNLYLPADPAVSSVSGIVFGDGTVQTTAATGGGNGTANRVQFANAGSIYQADDAEQDRYNIIVNAEKDVVINTDEESQEFRFTSTGNLKLPRNSTISDQEISVDLTVGRVSDNAYWYNLFGDTGATIDANTTVNGSVCHDSGGNVYSLGSVYHSVGFNTDNLFLKYSPEGNLLWRRTWTDDAGMDCGSLNASLRFIAANVELGTQDTIAWASWVPTQNISYVGTMDTEGNMVDEFGDTRLATRLDSVRVTDLEWFGNVYGDGNSIVGVAGNYYLFDGNDQYRPFVGTVDLDLGAIVYNSTVVPAGSNSNSGGWFNRPWDNTFKAITIPPGNLTGAAFVGTYYDGAHSHAMIAVTTGDTELFQIGQGTDDNIGEDICCDAYGNVYVIVNNTTSNYAVLSKVNIGALLNTQDSVWQIQLGFDPITVNDRFYASAVAYDNGYVYVLGTYYNVEDNNTDTMLIKVGIGNGDVVWQRRIGTAVDEGPAGAGVFGAPGWESSSGISIYDNLIAVTFSTEDNSVTGLNTVTLQYPTDGSVLGTFGDFTITDFDIGSTSADYGITTLASTNANPSITSGFATLDPTVLTVGTGWTNTQWDLENNREVVGTQTFKFNVDGTFDTKEIIHQSNVKITANTVSGTDAATWVFQNNKGLRFPDGSVQYGAYVETETALDGGSAVTVFNIIPRPTIADGGGSSSRHGVTDPVYDGSEGNDYVLDGGGA